MIIFQPPKPHKILTVQVVWVVVEVHNWVEGHSLMILLIGLIHPLGLAIQKLLSEQNPAYPGASTSGSIVENKRAAATSSNIPAGEDKAGTTGPTGRGPIYHI